jgi:hypothetical protein
MSSYYLALAGQDPQPFSESQIREMLASGELSGAELLAQDGWTEWQRVDALFQKPAPNLPPVVSPPNVNAAPSPVITTMPEITLAISTRPETIKVQRRSEGLLTREEFVVATAAQVMVLTSADGVVLTNRRILLVIPQLGGLKMAFVDWIWSDVVNVHIEEKVLGTTLTVQSRNRPQHSIDRLDKDEARAVYRIAQQMEEVIRVGRHRVEMEKLHAGAALMRR